MNRAKLKVFVGVLVVFLAGIALGVLGTTMFIRYQIRRFSGGNFERRTQFLMERLNRRLDLTEEQHPEVRRVIEQTDREIHELLQRSNEAFLTLMEARNQELKGVLTPEQQQRLDEMIAHLHNRLILRPDVKNPPLPPLRAP